VQAILPDHLIPDVLKKLMDWSLEVTADPITLAALGRRHGPPEDFAWVKPFFYLEGCIQFPLFFIGLWGLWNGSKRVNLLLLIYGASTATTVLPCLATILALPTTSDLTIKAAIYSLTDAQRTILLQSYIPFLVLPAMMMVDFGIRTLKLVSVAERALKKEEVKST